MRCVALFRGINVGGKNLVSMNELKAAFETAGMTSVSTYINSGNVLFSTTARDRARLTKRLTEAVSARFGFDAEILVREAGEMRAIAEAIPAEWTNDDAMRCDVLYLWDDVDDPSILERLPVKEGIDEVRYAPGAVIRMVSRANAAKSGIPKIAGTPPYRRITIRNCNTARKLVKLLE